MPYCIAISAPIKTDTCPLPRGQCYWQNTINNQCCYTDQELAPEDFCALTGKALPTEEERTQTLLKVKKILSPTSA